MKKVLYLVFGLIVVLTFTACGDEKNSDAKESATPTVSTQTPAPIETSESSNSKTPAISENKDVALENTAPKVFVLMPDIKDLSYHLEGCANLKGKNHMEMSWESVQSIGLWQCPTCNPPRYEGYKNAQ